MSKKKKPSAKRGINDTIAQRYQKIAENLIENTINISESGHVALSLVKSKVSDTGKIQVSRWDATFRKDEDGIAELPGDISMAAFASRLGVSLRNSEKDTFTYDLFSAFFPAQEEQTGSDQLEHPAFVYQWEVKEKTLSSEVISGDAWNGVSSIPGPSWNGLFFDSPSTPSLNPDDFTDHEITDAGILVTKFFEGIVDGASAGTHSLESTSAVYAEPAVIVFHKNNEGDVKVEQGLDAGLSKMSAMIIQGGNFSTALRSFIDEDINDSAGLMRNESAQEIRAWTVAKGDIYALNSKQIIDAYCRDFATGKIIETPENIAYLPAWKITS